MRVLRNGLLLVLGITLVGALGVGGYYLLGDPRRGTEAVATAEVRVADVAFDHPVITVPAGTEVTWTFDDVEAHNVAGDDWISPTMTRGVWSRTFDEPGTHDYVCALHPISMRARVVVT